MTGPIIMANPVNHVVIILAKFHENRAKIVELLPTANFFMCAVFLNQSLSCYGRVPERI